MRGLPGPWGKIESIAYQKHRRKILGIFRELAKSPKKYPAPFLIFAHIIAPHPPFVFGAHGEAVNPERKFSLSDDSHSITRISREEYIQGYTNQVTFVNRKLKETINAIIAGTKRPLVIILQADHGPGPTLNWKKIAATDLKERFSILNAYYATGLNYTQLYPEITPVNTFRIRLLAVSAIKRLPELSRATPSGAFTPAFVA